MPQAAEQPDGVAHEGLFHECGVAAVYHAKDGPVSALVPIAGERSSVARMVPVRANGQPAWGEYVRDLVTGVLRITGVLVAALSGDRICELVRFEAALAPSLGLPRTLDA